MSLFVIGSLIALGLFLLVIEFLLIPGVSVAGIAGFILLVVAVFFGYKDHDIYTANIVLGSTLVSSSVMAIFLLRANTWKRMSLNKSLDAKISYVEENEVKTGDIAICSSRLNPMGTVLINNKFFEAQSQGEFINENTEVEVIKIAGNTLIVKTKIK